MTRHFNTINNPNKGSALSFACCELFWLGTLLVYETVCFLSLSMLAIMFAPIFTSLIHKLPLPIDGHGPVLQAICSLLALLIFTQVYELLECIIVRPFINRVKIQHALLLSNIPAFLSVIGAFYFSWDILKQFYQRYDLLLHLPQPNVTTPIQCVTNVGYHMFWEIQQQCSSFPYLFFQVPTELNPEIVTESKNISRFIFGLMYLTYFVYKRALKRVPTMAVISFSDFTLTHVKSNCILLAVVFASVGAFDIFNGKFIHRDLFLYLLFIILVRIAEFLPWDRMFGVVSEQLFDGYEKKIIKGYSYWIHIIFFFMSISGMLYIFFKAQLYGKDNLIYFYERDEDNNNNVNNDEDFAFTIPSKISRGGNKNNDELRQISHTVNISVITFRALYTMMIISGTRCVEGYLKM